MKNKVAIFMPIRMNSKRISKKVVVPILGRPMFCHSLEKLDSLGYPVYLFTNCEDELKEVIDFKTKNVIFLKRPSRLDSCEIKGIDIYHEFSKIVDSEIYMLAHCTSPFVKTETYLKVIRAVLNESYDSSFTVEAKKTFAWYEGKKLNFQLPRPKTQELEPVLLETSAAYCYKKEVLKDNSRSSVNNKLILTTNLESVDIDDPGDLEIFDFCWGTLDVE